jgi:hypothetical protein
MDRIYIRIKQVMERKYGKLRGNQLAFSKATGINEATISAWLKSKNPPEVTLPQINRIVAAYSDKPISQEWLMSGKGEMLEQNEAIAIEKIYTRENISAEMSDIQADNKLAYEKAISRLEAKLEDKIEELQRCESKLNKFEDEIKSVMTQCVAALKERGLCADGGSVDNNDTKEHLSKAGNA